MRLKIEVAIFPAAAFAFILFNAPWEPLPLSTIIFQMLAGNIHVTI